MRDILKESYDIIAADEKVQQYVGNNIFFDVYPEIGSYKKPYIVMSDLDDPLPREYADNDNLALSYLDRKSTRLNSSHNNQSRMPSSA